MKEIGALVWAITDEGLYHVGSTSLKRRYPPEGDRPEEVTAIEKVGTEVWFSARRGLFRARGGSFDRVDFFIDDSTMQDPVTFILYDERRNAAWIGTQLGAVFLKNLSTQVPTEELSIESNAPLTFMSMVDGNPWAGTSDSLYYFDENHFRFDPFGDPLLKKIVRVLKIGIDIYLLRRIGDNHVSLLMMDADGHVELVADQVVNVENIDGELWFAQRDKLFHVSEDLVLEVDGLEQVVGDLSCIKHVGEYIWLGTTRGLFRRRAGKSDRPFEMIAVGEDSSFTVKDIVGTGDGVVSWSQTGVYRVLEDVRMQMVLNSISLDFFELLLFGDNLGVEQIKYLQVDGSEILLGDVNGPAKVILKKDKQEFDKALASSGGFDSIGTKTHLGAALLEQQQSVLFQGDSALRGSHELTSGRHMATGDR